MGRSLSGTIDYFSAKYQQMYLEHRIQYVLLIIQYIYYPTLAAVGIPINIVTIVILSQRKCDLSKCVTRYLVAMAAVDLLLMIIDLIVRHIPIIYKTEFTFLKTIPVCNIHAVLVFAAMDCSVWFTVAFTFDRFVAICCQKIKGNYCTEKTAAMVLGTITVVSCLKNISWYFMLTPWYKLRNQPWFCLAERYVMLSRVWGSIELIHYILTPALPFVLILLLNAFTGRYILVASRARRRLQSDSRGQHPKDRHLESRRKSIILMFVISGNFILLWSMFLVYSMWKRVYRLGYKSAFLHYFSRDIGFILQLLSCCTNTCIYAVTQTKFREQLKNMVKYPFARLVLFMK